MIIYYKSKTLDISFDHLSNGTRVWVFEWDEETREWEKVSSDLHILVTDFEALCNVASELFGEAVEGEALAQLLDVPMRSSDDVECVRCHRFESYESEDMVLGANMLPEVIGKLEITNWDYLCLDCYLDELQKANLAEVN